MPLSEVWYRSLEVYRMKCELCRKEKEWDKEIARDNRICFDCDKIVSDALGVKIDSEVNYTGTKEEKLRSRVLSNFIYLVGETYSRLLWFEKVYKSHTHSEKTLPLVNDIEGQKILVSQSKNKVFEDDSTY